MPQVQHPAHVKGDFFVDYEEKVFEDVKAQSGQKALVKFHTVAFEGSIGFVNLLQATRLQRKGFETSILLYGPGVTLALQRGFPRLGDEAFPGHQNYANQIAKFIAEGGKVYACRFALQALYGHGEPSLLQKLNISHIVCEKKQIGNSWRVDRWDTFCLVTPNWQCRLPDFPYQDNDPQRLYAQR